MADIKIDSINFINGYKDGKHGFDGILVYYDEPLVYIATIDNDPQKYLFKKWDEKRGSVDSWWDQTFACKISEEEFDWFARESEDDDFSPYDAVDNFFTRAEETLFITRTKDSKSYRMRSPKDWQKIEEAGFE